MQFRVLARRLVRYWVRTGHRDALTRDLDPLLRSLNGTVLDIGGGRPAHHDTAWDPMATRIRVDISPKLHPDVVGDACALPFQQGAIDGIIICEVLEHLAQPARAVAEAHRVLRPGGVLVGSVPFVMPVHRDPTDYGRYTADGLTLLLQPFSKIRILPHGNHLGAAWRLIAARFPALMILNPMCRLASRRRDADCPEGYVFHAVR